MKKLTLAVAVPTVLFGSPTVFAAPYPYVGYAMSGTAANPLASIATQAGTSTSVWYVNSTSGASNITTPSVQLTVASNWTFDWSNRAAVSFTGAIALGNYRVQTSTTGGYTVDGRESYTNVVIRFSGVGSYNDATRTFTYNFMNNTVNDGGATTFQATSTSCQNGKTSILAKVCTTFSSTSPEWEGLALNLVFAGNGTSFGGTLRGTNTFGSGLTRGTTTFNWQVSGVGPADNTYPFPIPASAWLFGSGLVGLGGLSRRRRKA